MLIIIYILILIICILSYLLYRKHKRQLQTNNQSIEPVGDNQEVLFRIIHDTKSSLSTAAMALHNLAFILTDQNNQSAPDEFIQAAQQAIDETNKRLGEAVAFSRTGTDNFEPVDARGIAQEIILNIDPTIEIISNFSTKLPFVFADSVALAMVFQKLVLCSRENSKNRQVLHFELESADDGFSKTICKIYNHKYLSIPNRNEKEFDITNAQLSDEKKMQLSIVKKLLSRHETILNGSFSESLGGNWSFILKGFRE
jgi:hypothetical protein